MIAAEFDPENGDQYTLDMFKQILSTHSKQLDGVTLIREALKVFDTEANGMVAISELRNVMTQLGEKQDPQGVENLLCQFETDEEGKVPYEEIVSHLA